IGLEAHTLRAIAVALLDAALGVKPVAAHVPLADRAARARLRIGPAHDADDVIAGLEPAIRGRFDHAGQRLVPEHETVIACRRPAILAAQDLGVGPAHAHREHLRQHGALAAIRLTDVVEPRGAGLAGNHRDRAHVSGSRRRTRSWT